MFVAFGIWAAFLGAAFVALTALLFVAAVISLRRQQLAERNARRHSPWAAYAGLTVAIPWLVLVAVRTVQYPQHFLVRDFIALFVLPQIVLSTICAYILRRDRTT